MPTPAADLYAQAHHENVRFVLRTLADRYAMPHLSTLVVSPRQSRRATLPACLQTLSHTLRHEPLDAREVAAEVDAQFSYRRGHDVIPTHFAIGLPTPTPVAVRSHRVTFGFPAAVTSVDARARHTLDVQKYIRNAMGEFLLRDAIMHQRFIELHVGTPGRAIGSLQARGFRRIIAVNTPLRYGLVEIFLVDDRSGGRLVLSGIYSPERLHHLLLMLYMARVDGHAIQPTQIEIHHGRYPRHLNVPRVDSAIIGFKNTVLADLERRATAVRLLSNVRSPWTARQVFRSHARADEILRRAGRACPPLHLARHVGEEAWDAAVLGYVDERGRRRTLLLARTPYGTQAASLGRALARRGTERVTLFGVAGGVAHDSAIGDIVIPHSYIDAVGHRVTGATNDLLKFPSEVARRGGQLRQVHSPLEETEPVIAAFRAAGHTLVEMEATALARELRGHRFASVHVVSDLPGTPGSLDAYHSQTARWSVREAIDLLCQYHGVDDVVAR